MLSFKEQPIYTYTVAVKMLHTVFVPVKIIRVRKLPEEMGFFREEWKKLESGSQIWIGRGCVVAGQLRTHTHVQGNFSKNRYPSHV